MPEQRKRKAGSSSHSPRTRKPGPKPVVPSSADRHSVMLAVAAGMSLELIADALEVSRRTLCRTFARELAVGRAKKLLESVVRLDDLAAAGNVSAAKFLHGLMMNHGNKPESFEDDKWAAIASKIEADMDEEADPNLPKNPEFRKFN